MSAYPDQFTPIDTSSMVYRDSWRPTVQDLAVYGATGAAVDAISGPSEVLQMTVKRWSAKAFVMSICAIKAAAGQSDT